MRRASWMIGVALIALLAGCESSRGTSTVRLPDPELQTRRPQPRPAPPPTYRPNIPVTVVPQAKSPPVGSLDAAGLMPPRGISKKWNVIVVHHTANTTDSPASIQNYHLHTRGWENGMGYHFVIGNGVNYADGKIFAGPRWKGQETGAHCKAGPGSYFGTWRPDNFFNERGVGVCLVGNFESSTPSARQVDSLEQLITFLCEQTGIPPSRVYGHGEVTHKTACPGRVLRTKLTQIRQRVSRNLAMGDPDYDGSPDTAYFLAQSGLDEDLAAVADADADCAGFAADACPECGQIGCAGLGDTLDEIADPQAGLCGGAVLGDVDDDDAFGGRCDLHALPRVGGQIRQAQAAPQDRIAAHPRHAADLPPLDRHAEVQVVAAAP